MLGIPRPNLDQVAVLAGDMVDLEHFSAVREQTADVVVTEWFLTPDRDEGESPLVDDVGIDLRRIAFDDTASFELPDPLENGGRRQPDVAGDVGLGFPGVCLKNLGNTEVYSVDYSASGHNERIIASFGRALPVPGLEGA